MKLNKIKNTATIILILQVCLFTTVCRQKAKTPTDLPQIGDVENPIVYQIRPQDMPKPYVTENASRSSSIVEQPENAQLYVPKGFKVNVFAENNFKRPRTLALAPNGDVFVVDSDANSVIVLRDNNKDGVADERFTFTENLNQPFGIAFFKDWLYIANTVSVVRFSYKSGQTKAENDPEKIISLVEGGYNQHWTRNIIFSPDGTKLYVSIGSSGNVDIEKDERRAAISVYDVDGKNGRIFASGLRNPVGLAFNPKTNELWTAVNERDGLGDDLVPDFVTSVKDGAFYGYPFSYIGKNIDPRRKDDLNQELVDKSIVPDVLLTSHSAALGMIFYDGKMFPAQYSGDAFVALHGSWNREKLTGYKIIRIRFKDGKLVGNYYEDFLTGWLPDESSDEVWGRPVGLLVNSDGSLLIADDGANKIWRVSFSK